MHTGGESDTSTVGATMGVATALDELKSRGSALLVVGSVPEEVYARVSACLLGSGCSGDRRRLVVEDGTAPQWRYESVDRWTPEWTRIIQCEVDARGTAAASSDGDGRPSPFEPATNQSLRPSSPQVSSNPSSRADGQGQTRERSRVTVDGSISDLGVEIGRAIQQFEAIAGGLEPAELRVGFDCIATLLAEYDEPTVFRFLHLLANDVRTADGMVHVRLPEPFDAETTRLFAPLFDGIVELRLNGSEPQQRWHLHDGDVVSEWLPIES
ncbi:DUF7504 family protein [Halobellus captivus]|uniref:DUF7504 family protein n=1 Tax=Halobellus captivus TaxID=2592614 RepID=UPI001EEFFD8A|nr:hypothetical protein [Halobellus captivus]